MKPKATLLNFFLTAGSSLLAMSSAHAATFYWDSNGNTIGAAVTPSGTWGSSAFWNTTATGDVTSPTAVTTTSVDDVFFSAGTDAVNAYAVGLNATTQNARLVTFDDGTATFSNGTLSLGNSGGITVASTTVTGATISSNLTISGAQTFNVAASQALTLNTGTFTRNAGSTLNILSTGTVTSTMTNLSANDATGIIGNWASFNTATNTTYAKFTGSTITGLGYTGGADGTAAATAAALTTGATTNFTFAGGAGALGGTSFNTLRYTGTGAAMTGAFTTNGIMNVGGGTLTFSNAVTSGTGEMVINAANGGITLSSTLNNNGNRVTFTGSGTTIITGVISGSGAVTMSGSGTLTLNNGNGFNGGFTLNSGRVGFGAGTYGGFGSGTLTVTGGNMTAANSDVVTINNALNWGGSLLINRQGGSGGTPTLTFTGPLTLSSNFALNLGVSTTAGSAAFTNNISGAFGINVVSAGPSGLTNTLTLSGANNTFSGGLSLNVAARGMFLNINSATALGATAGTFTIGSAGVVTIDNTSAAAITLANNNPLVFNNGFVFTGTRDLNMGTGTVNLGGAARTLTINGGIFTLGGVISNGGITKAGAGTLVLSGANTYTTATAVNVGLLNVTGSLTSAVTVANGAFLSGTGTTTGTLTLSTGSTIVGTTAGNSFRAATVGTTSAVNIVGNDGSGTIGSKTIGVVRYNTGTGPTIGNFSTAGYHSGASVANVGTSGGETQLSYTSAARTWDSAAGTWDAMITNAWQEGDFRFGHGDVLTFNDTGTGGGGARAVTLSSLVTPGSVTFDNSTSTYTVSGTGNIAGPTGLTKSGSGAVTLSNANSYTGGTTVTAGTLTTGSATALGSTSGQLVVNGGTLNMGSQSITVGNLTGTGGVISGTSGTRTLTIGQGNTGGGNYQGSIQNGASGTTALTKNGTGTLTLSGTNTYTGATIVGGGVGSKLIVNGNISTSVLTTVQTGATLGGTGTVGALTVNSGAFHTPGNSPGIQPTGNYSNAGTLGIEIDGTTVGTGYDQVNTTGTVSLSGLLSITMGYTPADNTLFFILANDLLDPITGTFSNAAVNGSIYNLGGQDFRISYFGDQTSPGFGTFTGGNDVVLMAIPEPSTALLGAIGLIALLRRRR